MDNPLFTTVDKRGIIVVCYESQWNQHIITGHPEVEGKDNIVKSTVSDPDIIFGSNEYNDRDVYFKSIGENDRHMKVIVSVSGNYGEVITAFPRKGVKGNIDTEVIKYVRP